MLISILIIPVLLIIALTLAIIKKKDAFSSFCSGALEGLKLSKEIIPSVIAMIAAVTIIKSSGMIDDLGQWLSSYFKRSEFITNIIPMVFFRPISGGASLAILNSVCEVNPDSFECISASLIQGSTDTTFYVIALYYSSIGVKKYRHTLVTGLLADVIGIFSAITLTLLMFG